MDPEAEVTEDTTPSDVQSGAQPNTTPSESEPAPTEVQPDTTPEAKPDTIPEAQPEVQPGTTPSEAQPDTTPSEAQPDTTPSETQPDTTPEAQSKPESTETQPEPAPPPEIQPSSEPTQPSESRSESPKMAAVIIGGTGATGRSLVGFLLKSKDLCRKVTVIGRRKVDTVSYEEVNIDEETAQGRLVQHVVDMDGVPDDEIKTMCEGADVFFCCLGTTRRAAGSAEAFVHIDCDIVVKFAKQAKEANIAHFSLVSSVGANANSFFLYLKTKGQVEQMVQDLNFQYTSILRPGLLGRGERNRFVEKVVGLVMRAMPVSTVAEAMAFDAHAYLRTRSEGEASTNVAFMDNSAIYRIVQESTK